MFSEIWNRGLFIYATWFCNKPAKLAISNTNAWPSRSATCKKPSQQEGILYNLYRAVNERSRKKASELNFFLITNAKSQHTRPRQGQRKRGRSGVRHFWWLTFASLATNNTDVVAALDHAMSTSICPTPLSCVCLRTERHFWSYLRKSRAFLYTFVPYLLRTMLCNCQRIRNTLRSPCVILRSVDVDSVRYVNIVCTTFVNDAVHYYTSRCIAVGSLLLFGCFIKAAWQSEPVSFSREKKKKKSGHNV